MFKKAVIIGGTGKMGLMFGKAMEKQGCSCLLLDENNLEKEDAGLTESELVILSVPIDVSVEVMRSIGDKLHSAQLLIDFTSIKSEIVPVMKEYQAQVVPTHPLFGPMDDFRGQNILLMGENNKEQVKLLETFFERLGLNVSVLETWEEHDRLMSYIQGLMHFIHIVFTKSLAHQKISLQTLMSISSPVYRANFAFACRIISRDPRLYSHILIDNEKNISVLEDFIDQAQLTLQTIKAKDDDNLNTELQSLNDYLGDYAGKFSKESDFLVEQITKYRQQNEK